MKDTAETFVVAFVFSLVAAVGTTLFMACNWGSPATYAAIEEATLACKHHGGLASVSVDGGWFLRKDHKDYEASCQNGIELSFYQAMKNRDFK